MCVSSVEELLTKGYLISFLPFVTMFQYYYYCHVNMWFLWDNNKD